MHSSNYWFVRENHIDSPDAPAGVEMSVSPGAEMDLAIVAYQQR